jgi:hypothetical protein
MNPILETLRDQACQQVDRNAERNLAEDRLAALRMMRDIVNKFRQIAVYIRKSPKARDRLSEYLVEHRLYAELMVLVDCPTRWDSTLVMLTRMIKLEPA